MQQSAKTKIGDADDAKVKVSLGERSYDVIIGGGLLPRAGALIAPILRKKRVAIITDETVAKLHLETLQHSLSDQEIEFTTVILPVGEKTKSLHHFGDLLDQLLAAQISRDECLIAFGGGVVGDLTGFAAATLRRGVDFIQIPTTLLSQVDSSVGGKTGINSSHGKNLIGAFYQPKLVLADVTLLDTLPRRDVLAGYAEVVKYALLGDFNFFEWLEENGLSVVDGDIAARIRAVETSVTAKARIVAEDEKEQGVRALLNLGHTFGHALEAETKYGPHLVHGEGVAVGMLMAMELSAKSGLMDGQDCVRVAAHYDRVGMMQSLPIIEGVKWLPATLLKHMHQDKKVDQGKLTFILMKAIGEAFVTQDVEQQDILTMLDQFTE
ncbi:3-dehydroquinate synthase [Alphaproteobacteria bacterium 46_93_T64]|nr:3-dehydroquinate synthase [Alphaproteobacteria bacterium 46_93_T64]